MTITESYDAVTKALRQLKRVRKLDGVILVKEGVIVSADTHFTEAQNAAYVREVSAFVSLYRNSGLALSRTLLGFDGGNALVIHTTGFTFSFFFEDGSDAGRIETSAQDFLKKFSGALKLDNESVIELTKLDMAEYPEEVEDDGAAVGEVVPDPIFSEIKTADVAESEVGPAEDGGVDSAAAWDAFQQGSEKLFCKVLGFAQARRIIQRELKAMGVEANGYLHPSQFRPFGQRLVQKVRDTTIRKQLEIEMIALAGRYSN